jgi:endo-1,3-1,4-beta-glycanase ExoK
MRHPRLTLSAASLLLTVAAEAGAVASAELYQEQTYTYGRFEARIRFAAGDGVISSFFLWKPGSEVAGTFWNELDFEKLGAGCQLQTNPLYGLPVADHHVFATLAADFCGEYHDYAFEWTPSYIAYLVDGVEVRRDEGETAAAFAENAASGMQIHFNVWPGDETFGGNFDPAILPVQQFISWVQYSSFADGAFSFQWREEFDGAALPSSWVVGNWASPKNLSTHAPANVELRDGRIVLSLTADDATGFAGTPPPDVAVGGADSGPPGLEPSAGAGGNSGTGGGPSVPAAGANAGGGGNGGGRDAGAGGDAGSGGDPSAFGGAPAGAGRPESSDGSCSQALNATSRSGSGAATWLTIAGVALMVTRRRRSSVVATSARRSGAKTG